MCIYVCVCNIISFCISTAQRSLYSRGWSTSPGPSFQPRVRPASRRWEPTESSCMNWKRRWRSVKSVRHFDRDSRKGFRKRSLCTLKILLSSGGADSGANPGDVEKAILPPPVCTWSDISAGFGVNGHH